MKNRKISMSILAVSLIFMAVGAYKGEIVTVFQKAMMICLECIGIG